ncbi:MAG: hypothetical protein ACI8S6_002216 [Myxococcota bacterium]|jgi:uncharacterized protein (TIGR00369 family)
MQPNTHLSIDPQLCGSVVTLSEGRAIVQLQTHPRLAADAHGLVHGGFVFGLADYAAMLAVNEPDVVLGSASVRFTAPVRAGELVVAEAHITEQSGRKHTAEVTARVGERTVFTGTFVAFVLDGHVLGGDGD